MMQQTPSELALAKLRTRLEEDSGVPEAVRNALLKDLAVDPLQGLGGYMAATVVWARDEDN